MKICYIGHGPYPHNVPFYVHTQLLGELGCEVHAIAWHRPGDPVVEKVGTVCVHRLPEGVVSSASSPSAIARFVRAVREILLTIDQVDLVHVSAGIGVSLLPLLLRKRIPHWVLEIRSPPLHGGVRVLLSRLRMRAEAMFFDRIFVHARAVADDIFGDGAHKMIELPIGVDFEHFRPGANDELRTTLGLSKTELVLVYSGSISTLRQLDRLLAGFALACHSLPNLHLLMLGEGDDAERLRQLANQLGIAGRVHFLGFVPYAKVPQQLHVADIGLGYVPMTAWYENAPVLKTMEFLASGLPTIATATQGNQHYIRHGENGLLVDDTPEAIAASIIMLGQDPQLRAKFRAVACGSIRQYDFRTIVRTVLLPAYQAVVATN
ncbi:MAG: hypothetical protein DCC55_20700 [Chloroflexi bacterium]|nr:MAG: hypothetical protein DCC55_20700 [Chloroflexota bacterium]